MCALRFIYALNVYKAWLGQRKSVNGPNGVFSTFGSSTSKIFSKTLKPKSVRVLGNKLHA